MASREKTCSQFLLEPPSQKKKKQKKKKANQIYAQNAALHSITEVFSTVTFTRQCPDLFLAQVFSTQDSRFTAFCQQTRKQRKLISSNSLLEKKRICICPYECLISVSLQNINLQPV